MNGSSPYVDDYVHLVWLGSPPPESVQSVVEQWSSRAGRIRLWTENDATAEFPGSRGLDAALPPAQRADILRVEILNRLGGWYFDVDYLPTARLQAVPRGKDALLALQDRNVFQNQCVFMRPGTRLGELWAERVSLGLDHLAAPVDRVSGPVALTQALYAYAFEAPSHVKGHGRSLRLPTEVGTLDPRVYMHVPAAVAGQGGRPPPTRVRPRAVHVGSASWRSQDAPNTASTLARTTWSFRKHTYGGAVLERATDSLRRVPALQRPLLLMGTGRPEREDAPSQKFEVQRVDSVKGLMRACLLEDRRIVVAHVAPELLAFAIRYGLGNVLVDRSEHASLAASACRAGWGRRRAPTQLAMRNPCTELLVKPRIPGLPLI